MLEHGYIQPWYLLMKHWCFLRQRRMAVFYFGSITIESINLIFNQKLISVASPWGVVWSSGERHNLQQHRSSGYWQVQLRKEDILKIAFKTRWGLNDFLVVPVGVSNAPAQFMSLMNDALADYPNDFFVMFLDNILMYSKNVEYHAVHLRKFLQKLQNHQFFAKVSKCEIAYESIELPGQQVTSFRMSSTAAKIKAVQEWDTAQDVKDVRSFLGFANYYQWYIHQFAAVAHPLIDLAKKGV